MLIVINHSLQTKVLTPPEMLTAIVRPIKLTARGVAVSAVRQLREVRRVVLAAILAVIVVVLVAAVV